MDPNAETSHPSAAAPVSPSERHEIIDVVRGFALFGVLLVNMVITTQWFAHSGAGSDSPESVDVGNFLVSWLADHKFYTLFSMLFGLGFSLQLSRAAARENNAIPTYARRLAILFVMGVAHAVLLWFGDILHVYALLGFVLILFRNRSDRAILRWTIAIAACTMLMPLVQWSIGMAGAHLPEPPITGMSPVERFSTMKNGGWADVVLLNWNRQVNFYTRLSLSPGDPIHWYLGVLWKFLLGLYIGRRMLLQDAAKYSLLFRRVLPWALVVGLLGSAYPASYGAPKGTAEFVLTWPLVEVAFFSLSMAYLCGLVLLHQRPFTRRIVGLFAPVGRMALTNYLTHSVCFVVLFYGVAFGLLGRVGIEGCFGLSVAIFAFQIIFSGWWLRYFRFGPAEWVWRCLTYGKRQPLRLSRR